MLKSTHRPAAPPPALPWGWTEHKAPTGHPYYYNAATQQSTYTRPTALQPVANRQASNASQYPSPGVPNGPNDQSQSQAFPQIFGATPYSLNNKSWTRANNGPPFKHHQRQPQPADRPKRKHAIPGWSPWLLVETKLGRRFVHNPEKGESYWKFPPEVMKGVVEYDKLQREKKVGIANGASPDAEDEEAVAAEEIAPAQSEIPGASLAPAVTAQQRNTADDSDEYEEVEVTDDEDEDNPSKRQKTEDVSEQPVEFDEDDMAYQLAAMGEDYGLDPGEYGEGGEGLEEGAEGLALTEEDSTALFKDMLNDYAISPYTTWENIIEGGQIVEDDRYTVLPNMKSRKEVWGEWSRERIHLLKEQREKEEKRDPRIPYMAFLQKYATPKLYWPEFRRKYKKEPEMHNTKLSDKDREKRYRECISRLKLPESTLKSDLAALLKFLPLHVLNKSTSMDALPSAMMTDMRYVSLKAAIRDPIIESHIASLYPAPSDTGVTPQELDALSQQRQERDRRERALADRQAQVQDEKRRQHGALQYSKGMLREGEQELERASKVGKDGLMGYMQSEKAPPLPETEAGL